MTVTTTHQTTTLNVVELQEWLKETLHSTRPTLHTNDCVRRRAKFSCVSDAGDVCSCGGDTASDNHWLLCPSCESGLSPTDLTAGRCTNCGVELEG